VEVLVDAGCVPRVVTGVGSVVVAAGPYRTSGEWWSGGGFARDHWEVHAADGALYRLYRDAAQKWFLEGYYD
jgi:protein ImuB